jgi:hypothetical protein
MFEHDMRRFFLPDDLPQPKDIGGVYISEGRGGQDGEDLISSGGAEVVVDCSDYGDRGPAT